MTTAEINAYLDWRAQREGRQVDVSPEAYEAHLLIERIMEICVSLHEGEDEMTSALLELYELTQEYHRLEKEN